MRGYRFELWLATTAIALIATGLPVQSAPRTEAEISAAVPMPEPANLPPPTASDLAPPLTAVSPGAAVPAKATSPVPASAQPAVGVPALVPPAAVAPAEVPAQTIDQRVAERLRDMFGGRIDRFIDR